MRMELRITGVAFRREAKDAPIVPPDGGRACEVVGEERRFLPHGVQDQQRSQRMAGDPTDVITQWIPPAQFRPERVTQERLECIGSAAAWFIRVRSGSVVATTAIRGLGVARAIADANQQKGGNTLRGTLCSIGLYRSVELIVAIHE